jgi:hypothetical protein
MLARGLSPPTGAVHHSRQLSEVLRTCLFKTSAAFHDLGLPEKPPNLVSVVRSKLALGSKFNILAQAGKVIEKEQADEVYWQAAA